METKFKSLFLHSLFNWLRTLDSICYGTFLNVLNNNQYIKVMLDF
jgi:hypothetical protein